MSTALFFQFFDACQVVNIISRDDRRKETVDDFKRHNLTMEEAGVVFFEAVRPKEKGEFPSIGSKGNFYSQLNAIKGARRKGAERILMMEDDLAFIDISDQIMTKIIAVIKEEQWDIVSFGYLDPSGLKPEGEFVAWKGQTRGTHCYAIRGEAIDRFIEFLEDCPTREQGDPMGHAMFFDGAYNFFRILNPELRFFIVSPCLFGQRSSRTNIHDLGLIDSTVGLRKLAEMFRAIKNYFKRISHVQSDEESTGTALSIEEELTCAKTFVEGITAANQKDWEQAIKLFEIVMKMDSHRDYASIYIDYAQRAMTKGK